MDNTQTTKKYFAEEVVWLEPKQWPFGKKKGKEVLSCGIVNYEAQN